MSAAIIELHQYRKTAGFLDRIQPFVDRSSTPGIQQLFRAMQDVQEEIWSIPTTCSRECKESRSFIPHLSTECSCTISQTVGEKAESLTLAVTTALALVPPIHEIQSHWQVTLIAKAQHTVLVLKHVRQGVPIMDVFDVPQEITGELA